MPMKVKVEFWWERIGSFGRMDPWCIAFAYPQRHEPFIVKGGLNSVEGFFKTYKSPVLVHFTYWYRGQSRTVVRVFNTGDIRVFFTFKHHRVDMTVYGGRKIFSKTLRRVPRKWMKELDKYVEGEEWNTYL